MAGLCSENSKLKVFLIAKNEKHKQLGIWTLLPVASVYAHEDTESEGQVTTSADTLTQNQMDHRDTYTHISTSADAISITSSIMNAEK